jgi:hypothetical protein
MDLEENNVLVGVCTAIFIAVAVWTAPSTGAQSDPTQGANSELHQDSVLLQDAGVDDAGVPPPYVSVAPRAPDAPEADPFFMGS